MGKTNRFEEIKNNYMADKTKISDIGWLIQQVAEYQQWFKVASENVNEKDKTIEKLSKQLEETTNKLSRYERVLKEITLEVNISWANFKAENAVKEAK